MELAVGLLFLVCYTYTLDPVTACFAGAIISLLTMGAIYDHFYFLLPDVVLNGAPLIALAMACYNGKHTLITACTGGVISAAALYAIKRTGEVFLTRTEKVNGYLKVDSQGITLIDADGKEEHTTWPEFVFTKVIPQGHLVINDIQCPAWQTASGQQKPYLVQDGDLIIYDGSATLGGHPVDLNKGFTVKVEQLKIHRNAMGLGDVRLALPLGILIGFNSGLYEALFFACCTGLAHGLYLRRQDRRLPFGPHLMLGTAYVLASQHGTVPAIKTLLVYLGGK
jgi:prepilin signal peptidase PulO-like enzyme (type II secretory pathway)